VTSPVAKPLRWLWQQKKQAEEEKFIRRVRCCECYMKGKLRQTGWEHPQSWFCPCCFAVYGDDGKLHKAVKYNGKMIPILEGRKK